jgi:3-hydroxyisobutyrate dehydrogenase-like beta-hydroxyacid dehydrogenase
MDRIGVIGLGRMGSAMAVRLAAQGVPVMGWTRSGRVVDTVPSAPDLAALVAASDVLILSLYDDAAVSEMLDALLALDLAGKLIIETSTAVPQNLTTRADKLADAGAQIVDAPVSGGPEMVANGTCGVFIGGFDAAAARATPVLGLFAGRIFHVGPLGTGLVMKVVNNAMLQAYVGALRELLPMAKRAGLPLETAMNILNGGPAGMPMIRDRLPKILGEDEEVGFTMTAVLKDNLVFQDVARSFGVTPVFLAAAETGHRQIIEAGLGEKDPAIAIAAAYHDA